MDVFARAALLFRELQARIISGLEEAERDAPLFHPEALVGPQRDPQTFRTDAWERGPESSIHTGGGVTRVLEQGRIFERAGVNFSDVAGTFTEGMAQAMPGSSREFRASGVSLVLHPRNPHAPTVHANFRVIRRGSAESPEKLWFGGGADLTPYILYEDDARDFHRNWRDVCGRHPHVADYAAMKRACDEYFYLPHRSESRGVGGIFFDYLDLDSDSVLSFVDEAGHSFVDSYTQILARRTALPYTNRERQFQLLRRGRYVEFNLVYDRGTQFGLRTGGRTESILMSLPPAVHWEYGESHLPDGAEAALLDVLKSPREWV